jgi:L-cysteate sulfo-lyase
LSAAPGLRPGDLSVSATTSPTSSAGAGARHVVVAVGSGGTMAGLVAGLGAGRVLGVDTGAVPDPVERVTDLVTALGGDAAGLRLRRDQVGGGYGARTDAAVSALRTAARTEGLLLDPVNTAKAMAGLAAAVADGSIRPGEPTAFVHTGGLPGLFGHPVAAELAAGALDPPGPGSDVASRAR